MTTDTLLKIREVPGVCTYWKFRDYIVTSYPNARSIFIEAITARGTCRQVRAPQVAKAVRELIDATEVGA